MQYIKYIAAVTAVAVLITLLVDARLHHLHPAVRKPIQSQAGYEALQQEILDYTATQEGVFAVYFKDLPPARSWGSTRMLPSRGRAVSRCL